MPRKTPRQLGVAALIAVAFATGEVRAGGPPDIDPIPNQFVSEDAAAFTVPVAVEPASNGPQDAVQSVVVANVAPAGIVTAVMSPSEPWLVTVTPQPNAAGTVTVTVRATDAELDFADASFSVTVDPLNDQPTIDPLGPLTIGEDVVAGVPVTVGDVDGDALTVTATSSNPAVVTNGGLVVTGSGGSRTLTITPVADASGAATITVTVTDNGSPPLSAQQSFTLTVNPVNDAPGFTSVPVTAAAEDVLYAYAVTAGDVDPGAVLAIAAPVKPAWLTLVDHGNGTATLGGTPGNGDVGPHAVTLTVSDGVAAPVTQSFTVTVANTNDAPTIDPLGPVTVSEDTVTAVPVTVGDVDSADVLTVTATSSNAAVVNDAGLVVTGGGTSRTLTITPATNAPGTATITVTVADNGSPPLSAQQAFTLTVNPVNDLPTITPIANQTIPEDGSTSALAFTVGDVETAASSLSVSATSDNLSLVPEANIVFGGSGPSRVVTVTPVANASGSATITITVADGDSGLATTAFTVTVTAQNDLPAISGIADQVVGEDTPTAALAFTVGDVETPAASLLVSAASTNTTLVPVANVLLGGGGAGRTVTVAPALNQTGTATITLTVTDGDGGEASTSFDLTVTSQNDAPAITGIGPQTIAEDGSTGALAFSVADAETPPDSLVVTASSDNATLVPLANIAIGGSGAARTVTVTPAANLSGVATITLTVVDLDVTPAQASTSFTVTVSAVNDPPAISNIGDQSTTQDVPTAPIPFTVADVETAAASLAVTAVSDNQTVVPNGGVILGGAGAARTIALVPSAGQTGTATITVTVSDGTAQTIDTFVLTVGGPNAPTISDIPDQVVAEDGALAPVAFAVGDPEGLLDAVAPVTAVSSNQALVPNGSITIAGGPGVGPRTIAATAAGNASGTTTITVTVRDHTGLTAVDSFLLTVTPVNDGPTLAAVGAQTTNEDVVKAVPLTVGDVDAGDTLTVTATSDNAAVVTNAGLSVTGTGASRTLTITPVTNATGTAGVTVTVTDNGSPPLSAQQTFTLTVNPVNDLPTISGIPDQSTAEDVSTAALPFTVADVETPAGSLSVTRASSNTTLVPVASIVLGGSGADRTVTVTPAANRSGTATITLTVTDGDSGQAGTSFVLTVTAANDAPTIDAIAAQSTNEDQQKAVLLTVGDLDGDALAVSATSSNPTVVGDAGLVVTGTGSSRTLTVTPVTNASGATTITVTVTDDGSPPLSAQRSFTLTVNSVNDAPEVSPVSAQVTGEDAALAVAVAYDDVDSALTSPPFSFTITSSNTTLVPNANLALTGSASPRTLTITPAADQTGTTQITITASDGSASSAPVSFTLTVTAADDAPVVDAIGDRTTAEDTAVAVLVGYSDVDTPLASPPFTFTLTSSNTALVPNPNLVLTGGTSPRTLTITPAAGQSGTTTITVVASDGVSSSSPVSFTLTVTPVNDAPFIDPIGAVSTNEDVVTAVPVTVGDPDAGDALTVTATSGNTDLVTNAGLVVTGSGSSRTLTITPVGNATGTATITVTVTDNGTPPLSALRSFTFTANAVNDLPTITPVANRTIDEDGTTGALAFTVGDVETAAGALVVTASSDNATLVPAASIVLGGSGAGRTIVVTPAPGLSGVATITLTVADGDGGQAVTAFTVTVNAVNDPPTISNIGDESTVQNIATGPIAFTVADAETAAASLVVTATSANQTLVPNGSIALGGAGGARTITLTPTSGQTGTATITVTVSDGQAQAIDTFVLTVNPPNAPRISDVANQTVAEDVATGVIPFTVSDSDGVVGAVTAISSNTALVPASGVALGGGPGIGAWTIRLTPAANQFGTTTITITAEDHTGDPARRGITSFTLAVTPVNDAPTLAAIGAQVTSEDVAKAVPLTVGDVDPADTLTVTATSANTAVIANTGLVVTGTGASRTLTLTPVPNASGSADITVSVTDNGSPTPLTAQRTFTLTVNGVNDLPTISGIADLPVVEDTPTAALAFTVGDVETAAGSLVVTRASSNTTLVPAGNIVLGGSGASRTVTVTPAANRTGTATVTLTVADDNVPAGQASTSFVLTVTAANDAPTVSAIAAQATNEDTLKTVALTVGDVDGDALTVAAASSDQTLVADGGLTVTGTGASRTLRIEPVADASGVATITVTAADNGTPPLTAVRSFTLTVNAVNDAPTISDIADRQTPVNTPIQVAFTIGDPDGDVSSLNISATSSNASLVKPGGLGFGGVGPSRTLTVTPELNQSGVAQISVRVNDGQSANVTRTFTLTVNDVACAFSASALPLAFGSGGGGGSATVDAARGADSLGTGCAWAVSVNQPWVLVSSPGSGFGDGSLPFSVAPNTGAASRTATLTVAGQVFTITQAGVPVCTYTFGPSPQSVPSAGGPFSLTVGATGTGCQPWTAKAEPGATWLAITAGTGQGAGLVSLTASENTGTVRSGLVQLSFGGTTLQARVDQAAATVCSYVVAPDRLAYGPAGGQRTVTVQAPAQCAWAVAPSPPSPWVSLSSGSGFGNGGIVVTASSNGTGPPREAALVVRDAGNAEVARIVVSQDSPTEGDADGDGLPSAWEIQFGLDSASADGEDGALGDPDGDGLTNLEERRNCDEPVGCTHPRGFAENTRYLPEGASSSFFETRFALLNPGDTTATVQMRFQRTDGTSASQYVALPPRSRRTVIASGVAGLQVAEFSTLVESDEPVVVDRTMTWDRSGYGSHAETGMPSPRTLWYLAEGATLGDFDLFYLVQNPNTVPAEIEVRFLRPNGPPVTVAYQVAAISRFNIWVDQMVPELANAEVSAVIRSTNGVPVLVERAMYLSGGGRTFAAGHESAAVAEPATHWFLAEGATGSFFDLFVLVANPNPDAAVIEARYLLSDGTVITKPYLVAGNSRFNIWVDLEDPRLASANVSTTITSTNGVPVIVERAMWWPGPTAATWAEAHNSAGATTTGTTWALAEGEQGGTPGHETYVLIANTSPFAGQARVTLVVEDGPPLEQVITLLANSRTNVAVGSDFPQAAGKRFGVIVESLGSDPAQIVVERAMYTSPGGQMWAAGTNALATRIR
jgi:hypothetical protein